MVMIELQINPRRWVWVPDIGFAFAEYGGYFEWLGVFVYVELAW